MEKRKPASGRSTPLPVDFAKVVTEVLSANFDAGLQALARIRKRPTRFEVTGNIHPDEVVLCVSIVHEGELAATSVYASSDFDPKASAPNVQDVLGACVDAVGALLGQLLDPAQKERLEQLADESMSAMEDVPFEWTLVEIDRFKVHLKMDKANPKLEELADEWLARNDPGLKDLERQTQEETEKLFVTGKPKAGDRGGSGGPGGLH